MNKITIKDIAIIVVLTAILFAQEALLSFLPNFQLTVFLLVLYSKKLGLLKTSLIILVHAILDTMIFGAMNFIYLPFILMGWILIPITLNTIFKKVESNIILALLGILFSLLYSWIYIIPSVWLLDIGVLEYLAADLLWEVVLAISSFLTILLLYNPCSRLFDRILNNNQAIE